MPMDSRCSNVRILGLPSLPIVEVLDGLLDGRVCPPGWALLEIDAGLHEVMEDPGGLGLAHGITSGEVREFPGDEAGHLTVFELLGPTCEVFLRIQGAVIVLEGLLEFLDAVLMLLHVLWVDVARVLLMMLLEDLPSGLDVGARGSFLDAIIWRLPDVLALPDIPEVPGAPGRLHVFLVGRISRFWLTHIWQRTWRWWRPREVPCSILRGRRWIKAIKENVVRRLWRLLVTNEVLPEGPCESGGWGLHRFQP